VVAVNLRPANVVVVLAVLGLTLGFSEWVGRLEAARDYERQRALVLAEASSMRARLEAEINSTLYLARGLVAYTAANPRLTRHEFNRFAQEILRDGREVRNISLAPNNVLTWIYPLQGNEAAIGLRYLENPAQAEVVRRVMETRQAAVAGPIDLLQGGRAFISRSPIFTTLRDGSTRYWGLASVVIDADALLANAGLKGTSTSTRYAMRGKDGTGAQGEVFLGDQSLFHTYPVLLTIELPGGAWQLAAVPEGGWLNGNRRINRYRLPGIALALLFSGLIAVLLMEREREKHLALHDPLTGLPNRLFFDLRLEHAVEAARRHKRSFALLYLDLDDFKPVNDKLGHKAGDHVLIVTGRRLRETLRRVDTVARIGGDEFMIILEDVPAAQEAVQVAEKLIANLRVPMLVPGGHVTVGASVGISFYPTDGATPDHLIRAADRAMYQAKSAGKNRCETTVPLPA
jgi:diguanylate cyclase (GGDEF)-like protein